MRGRFFTVTVLAIALCSPATLVGQDFALTVENIMRGPELVGTAPRGLGGGGGFFGGGEVFSWSPDSRYIYFRWQQSGVDTTAVPYRIEARGGTPERLADGVADTVLAGAAVWSPDRRRAVFTKSGDLVLWDQGRRRHLTRTFEDEQSPQWSPDGQTLFFLRAGNVYSMDLERGAMRQLTDIRRGNAPPDPREPQGQRKFLVDQQKELFDVIRRGATSQTLNAGAQDTANADRPKPFYPGENRAASGLRVSPDGNFVLFTVTERPGTAQQTEMAVWVTDDGYASTRDIRTKVGDVQSKSRAAVLEVATGEVTFVAENVGGGDRNMRGIAISPNSKYALVRVETHDDEDRWYVTVDLASLEERVIDHLHDDAWLAGPLYTTAGFMPDGETVYFGSEKTGWAHLYTVPVSGGDARALTSGEWEVLSARLSPDRQTWYITANKEGFAEVHFYSMPASGVHGAGYTQNVHNWWSNYYREYMFHHLLASKGYTVIDVDYRASAGHGRDWRTAIDRSMGGVDLDDHEDDARWLVDNMGVHADRIGIYGGSYGGFITLMAMFTKPGVFRAGAALRPVTDWAHYNHGYTSNILNEPQNDTLAYKRSSPIYFAEGLEGHLLIAHGMVDDNVHFLDTVRLAQRLIELKKENWEVAMYPVEPHGFRQVTSWIDEYRRILKLFEQNLK